MTTTTDTTTLAEQYEAALLEGDEERVQAIEAEFARIEVEARRAEALERAEARQIAEAQQRAEAEAREAEQAARREAQEKLDVADKALRKAAAAFAKAAAEVMPLGVVARNASMHGEAAQAIRAAVAAHVPEPFQRRLLSELGRPRHDAGGPL